MKPIIIQNLTKSYGSIEAIENISFEVEDGELFGLIGPDGAGKTTIFRILTTLLKPDSGDASVLGMEVVDNYKSIRPKGYTGPYPGGIHIHAGQGTA